MTLQLPLGISLPVFKRFDSFVCAGNDLLLSMLRNLSVRQGEQQVFIWGAQGSGKTHLLHAICDLANQFGHTVSYIPLARSAEVAAAILAGLENLDVVCVDDCEQVYRQDEWERSLFNLINACRETQTRLLFASQANPVKADITLPDLQSRFQWGPVVHLQSLHDEHKLSFLQQRAAAMGLELDEKTANYILLHYRRDMESLSALLSQLDTASLAAGRRLSIPFIKQVIDEQLPASQ